MGFPASFTDLLLPKLFIHFLSFLSLLRALIFFSSRLLGLHHFLDPPGIPSDPSPTDLYPLSAALLRHSLPVVRFSDLPHPPDTCAVCLYEFDPHDQIRRLAHCRHIFHRGCVDRWIGCGRRTCPLCRTVFVPANLRSGGLDFDFRFWDDEEIMAALHSDSSSSSMNLLVSGS